MIKTLFRGYINAGYSAFDWGFATGILCIILTPLMGFGTYWGIYLFTPIGGYQALYLGWAAGIATPFYWIGKWVFYMGQEQRGTFDKKRSWKIFKRREPKVTPGEDALNFIQEIRRTR